MTIQRGSYSQAELQFTISPKIVALFEPHCLPSPDELIHPSLDKARGIFDGQGQELWLIILSPSSQQPPIRVSSASTEKHRLEQPESQQVNILPTTMPSILSDSDRDTVKRNVPKPGNKILAVAVVRLYVAYPNQNRWTYTGLQGAAVLANDLVGNTFWLKMVDIAQSNRGVIWDQELYEGFNYNQDRTFFHTFELEDCLAGFSFVDEKEAKTFRKKMDEREKNASKATKATAFIGQGETHTSVPEKHGRFTSLLHRHKSPQPAVQPHQSIIPPRADNTPATIQSKTAMLDEVDPSWRNLLGDLLTMGITEEQIEENAEFIKSYILDQKKKQAEGPVLVQERGPPPRPPHPPTAPSVAVRSESSHDSASKRTGPPPPPPAPRRTKAPAVPSPPRSPPTTPPPAQPRFRAPPPIADAGKYAHSEPPSLPTRSSPAASAPPPPPRPPKTPLEDEEPSKSKFAVPPPFQSHKANGDPPLPPTRGPVPPPPPRSRQPSSAAVHAVPPAASPPPPLPPKTPQAPVSSAASLLPPPPPPPLPPVQRAGQASTGAASMSSNAAGPPLPPPPPPPPLGVPPASMAGGGPPPPPPPPPDRGSGPSAPPQPATGDARDDLLASIRAAGGSGLKKVSESEKRDRSAASVPGSAAAGAPTPAGASSAGGAEGGLADALQKALSARNKKVSASDDEDDNDDWD